MGVHGLWKLLEPTGQMVPLESLAGKVLAVDISIWLHQAVKGMHDAHGAPLAVAHLLILFHRLCKLLYYKIKPVFVFDGGVPLLKSQTMAARRQRSTAAKSEAFKVREKLIKNLLKHEAVRQVLSNETASAALGLNSFTLPGPSVEEDLYKLPPIAADYVDSECSDAATSSEEESDRHAEDIHSIDVTSQDFLSLPAEVRHDILTELIETRKQSSWKFLDSMPKQSDNFSDFQMNRLLKRHAVQTSLEKAGKEMGGRALSLKELESLLGDQGVLDPKMDLPSRRIAQDNTTRYMLVQKESEVAPKEFDIMERLEEVEWSSESDTDVILEKKRSDRREMAESAEGGTSSKSGAENGRSNLVARATKVRITEEVADILSVLEDKDAAADVKIKVENLQSKINFNINSRATDSETDLTGTVENVVDTEVKGVCAAEDSSALREDPDASSAVVSADMAESGKKISDKVDEDPEASSAVVSADMAESGKKISDKVDEDPEASSAVVSADMAESGKKISDKVDEDPEASSAVVSADIAESEKKISDKVDVETAETEALEEVKNEAQPIIAVGTEETENSSSDAESDFVPITPAETESVLPQQDAPSPCAPPKESDSLTVVINPSELSQKDDLFADIFDAQAPVEAADAADENKTEFEELQKVSINDLGKALEEEHSHLLKEKGRQERHAMNLTDQIYTDAQELLQLFGVPFVVAPMEAEAQCATLNVLGLTEGTITDDSDIWLFGGLVVYKNFFNQNKHVLEYRSDNIERKFKLTREEMIKMALLVGSDYTAGLSGIGPVTAMEILAAFQTPSRGTLEGLVKFRDWFTGSTKGGPPRATLRKKIRNTVITSGFPSRAVVEAYLHPLVDDSREPFSWAKPNLDLIRKYVRAKMGWSAEKCNDLLLPVMKKLEEKTNQTTIDKHFRMMQTSREVDVMLSKRVENAVKRLGNSSMESDEPADDAKPRKKRKTNSNGKPTEGTSAEADSKSVAMKSTSSESNRVARNPTNDAEAKLKLIKAKLHRNAKVPQREMAQKVLEEKKKEAIKIFRTYGKAGKKKTKVFAKEEANLSESSSEND